MSGGERSPRALDASSLINLLAIETELARAILLANASPFVVTDEVAKEVLRDPRVPGQPVAIRLEALSADLIERVSLGPALAERFIELTALMDDGEASVLAYAEATSGIAVIDDDDGRTGFVAVELEWTIDLLLHARERIATTQLAVAVYDAGKLARMRFPVRRRDEVVALIGEERGRECPGLRRAFRHR